MSKQQYLVQVGFLRPTDKWTRKNIADLLRRERKFPNTIERPNVAGIKYYIHPYAILTR